ncbi:MAG TPA: ATP-binding protein [Ktedonobacteraceae bacterium]
MSRPCLRRWQPGIRLQLTLWYTIVFTLLMLCSDVLLYTHLQSSLLEGLDAELHLRAQQVADDVVDEQGNLVFLQTTKELPGFDTDATEQARNDADVNFGTLVRVLDAHGQVVGVTPSFRLLMVPAVSVTSPLHGTPWQGSIWDDERQNVRLYSRALTNEGTTIAVIQVGASLTQVDTALSTVLLILLSMAPFVLGLSALGSYVLAARTFKPIDRLIRSAQRIKAGDLRQRVPLPPARDEVSRLARTLNEMLDALEEAFTQQQRFVADASHELRTPVAAIRSITDVALLEPLSPEAYVTVLQTVNMEAERLGSLISDLLELARADEGQTPLQLEPVRLDLLVHAIVGNMTPFVEKRHLRLHVEAPHPVTIQGDEARLIQLIMNLLDNAIYSTEAGGQITVTVQAAQQQVQLQVQDTGRGIAAEHLPHIFERFYRGDAAHTANEPGRSGLGLAIVDWIVHVHQGSIMVESKPGQGSAFIVLLPLRS